MKEGKDGCSSCDLFHPALCYGSVSERKCSKENCSYIHLPKTDRKAKNDSKKDEPNKDPLKSKDKTPVSSTNPPPPFLGQEQVQRKSNQEVRMEALNMEKEMVNSVTSMMTMMKQTQEQMTAMIKESKEQREFTQFLMKQQQFSCQFPQQQQPNLVPLAWRSMGSH